MKAYVGITDYDWFRHLASQPHLEEVNFWQPGGSRVFGALQPGELFLFKLHSPRDFIVGGGIFAHATRLPVSLAWEAFGEANGVQSLAEMRERVGRYRRAAVDPREDFTIGCILLEQPFFLPEPLWIPAPRGWAPQIVQGKTYDLRADAGRELWTAVTRAVDATPVAQEWPAQTADTPSDRYGQPVPVRPRLGQGTFRVVVTDAYARRCSVTGERVLPVLEAAHIRPYAEGGDHRVENGLLLRSDLHKLFDRGYVTVTPEHRVEVSRRIREDFDNGRLYYGLHGGEIRVPEEASDHPDPDLLRWHNESTFLG